MSFKEAVPGPKTAIQTDMRVGLAIVHAVDVLQPDDSISDAEEGEHPDSKRKKRQKKKQKEMAVEKRPILKVPAFPMLVRRTL